MSKNVGLSKQEMRHEIKRINRVDLSKSNYPTIKALVSKMLSGVPIRVSPMLPQDLLFRARKKRNEKFQYVKDLCAPPADFVTGFQRCNAPNQPMFYCSSRRITAMLEIDVEVGDIVYLSQWMANTRLAVNRILDDQNSEELDRRLTDRDEMFYAFVDTLFTKRVNPVFSADYMISAAISEICTGDFLPDNDRFIGSDGKVGLKYPSVVDLEGSYNIALPPAFTEDRIGVLHVMEVEVTECDRHHVAVKLLDTALNFDDGEIRWTGNNVSLPVPKAASKGVAFRFDGKKWCLLTTEHLPIEAEQSDHLLQALLRE